ncbi:MAG: F0F1 ATP synthase subunit delta [Peptococcaceae bacterium]|nr:F0F1 ATP synthase subunit delta [Peptococcaceae bacterium]
MLSEAVARKYAQALFDIAAEVNLVDRFTDELKLVVDTLAEHPDFQRVLNHPHITPEAKQKLVAEVFGGAFSAQMQNFLNLIIDRRRQVYLRDIYHVYKTLADISHNLVEVQVKGAVALDQAQQASLSDSLAKLTGKLVRLVAQVDPSLIGGVVVKIGDRVYDGSVAGRLAKLKEALV